MPTAPRRTITILLVIAALLAFALVLFAATSTEAMCSACHEMEPFVQAVRESSHATLGCYECHSAGGWWGAPERKSAEFFGMYPAHFSSETVDGISGPSTPIPSSQCLRCHEAVMSDVADKNGLRIRHESCTAGTSTCAQCHSAIAHGATTRWISEPSMEECIACHVAEGAPTDCDVCHVGRIEAERLSRGPWATTHGPEWKTTHGAGALASCITCHAESVCIKCHGTPIPHSRGFYNTHGDEAQTEGARCLDCHDKTALCDPCHGEPMPHADDYVARHSELASARDDESCLETCHTEADCSTCHLKHTHPGITDGTLQSDLSEAQGVFE